MKVLLLLHTEADGTLARLSLEALSTALRLGDVTVGLVGDAVQAAANLIALSGIKSIISAESPELAQSRYGTDAAAAEALCRTAGDATLIVAPATSRWMRTLPGVAHRIGAAVDAHLTSIEPSGAVWRCAAGSTAIAWKAR